MTTQIQTLNDVVAFAKHLVEVEKLSFHQMMISGII